MGKSRFKLAGIAEARKTEVAARLPVCPPTRLPVYPRRLRPRPQQLSHGKDLPDVIRGVVDGDEDRAQVRLSVPHGTFAVRSMLGRIVISLMCSRSRSTAAMLSSHAASDGGAGDGASTRQAT